MFDNNNNNVHDRFDGSLLQHAIKEGIIERLQQNQPFEINTYVIDVTFNNVHYTQLKYINNLLYLVNDNNDNLDLDKLTIEELKTIVEQI